MKKSCVEENNKLHVLPRIGGRGEGRIEKKEKHWVLRKEESRIRGKLIKERAKGRHGKEGKLKL